MDLKSYLFTGLKVIILQLAASLLALAPMLLLSYLFSFNIYTEVIGLIIALPIYVLILGFTFEKIGGL